MKVEKRFANLEICFDNKKEIELLIRNPLIAKVDGKKLILSYDEKIGYYHITFDNNEEIKKVLTKNKNKDISKEDTEKEEAWKKVKEIKLEIGKDIYEDLEVSQFANIRFENGDQIGFIGVD